MDFCEIFFFFFFSDLLVFDISRISKISRLFCFFGGIFEKCQINLKIIKVNTLHNNIERNCIKIPLQELKVGSV